jgi:hypothetical protein
VGLERLRGRGRHGFFPQRVDELVLRDDLVCAEKQNDEEGSLLRPAKLDRAVALENLDRSKNAKFHRVPQFA